MQRRLASLLRCPVDQGPLRLVVAREERIERLPGPEMPAAPAGFAADPAEAAWEVIEGALENERSGRRYPILGGVPRMTVDPDTGAASSGEATADPAARLGPEYRQTVGHFDRQWREFARLEKSFGRDVEASWSYFREMLCPPDVPDNWFAGKLLLDAGCGHGKYLDALSRRHPVEIVGLEITRAVDFVYPRLRERPNVHVVQGNVMAPPFARSSFDGVFSSGVIHHTPDTRRSFDALAGLPKPGGFFAIWVYPYRSALWEGVQQPLRAITTRLPRPVLLPLCYAAVPLLSIFPAYSGTSLGNASWAECAQVVFDFYGPKYQTHHRPDEVASWFRAAGYGAPYFGRDPLSAVATRGDRGPPPS